jgi:hypothetical protein
MARFKLSKGWLNSFLLIPAGISKREMDREGKEKFGILNAEKLENLTGCKNL